MTFKKHFNLRVKFLLSYLLILLVPLSVLGIVMYNNTVVSLKSEVEESNLNMLNQVQEMLELQVEGFRHTVARIETNPTLRPRMIERSIDNKQVVAELQDYNGNNPFAEDILLYFRGKDFVYTSQGISSLDTITDYKYSFSGTAKQQFVQDLNTSKIMTVQLMENSITKKNKNNLLAYMFPIKNLGSVEPYGTVSFMINESSLHGQMENILGDNYGSVYVMGADNEIIASKNDGDSLRSEREIELINSNLEPGIHTLNFDKEEFSLILVKSDATGWSYMVLLPTEQFMKKVLEMKSFITILIVSVILVGVGLSIIFSINYYRPIKGLVDYLRSSSRGNEAALTNEFDVIRTSLHETFKTVDAQKPYVRDRYFYNLLKGKNEDGLDISSLLNASELQLTGDKFFVVVASLANNIHEDMGSLDNIISFVTNEYFCYGIELFEENKFAIIVNLQAQNINEELQKKNSVSQISAKIRKTSRSITGLGVGKIYGDTKDIHRSFIEATTAVEYTFKTGEGSIVYFDEVNGSSENSSWYSFDEELAFIQSIKRADETFALDSLHNMFKAISAKEHSIVLLKCMSYDIMNTVLKTIKDMGLDQFTNNLQDLLEFKTLTELESGLEQLIREVCQHVNEAKESKNSEKITKILNYINKNYTSYDLTLENIADHFQMSSSYLSRFMKNQTGYTFTEYLLDLRMKEVKNKLKKSNRPIKDIISDVGYVDVSNFMRKFKKEEGITPGEYRKINANSVQK